MSLTFDSATHTYRFEERVVPSVTQVLKASGIIDYSMIPQDVLQHKAALGTAVHKACELFDLDDLDESSLTEEVSLYLESYKRWLDHTGFQSASIERRVYHSSYQFAGTLDRTGIFPDGRRGLVDFKTGIILPGHKIQLAAYTMTQKDPFGFSRFTLQLQSDGSIAKEQGHHADTLIEHFDVFLSALNITNFKLNEGIAL